MTARYISRMIATGDVRAAFDGFDGSRVDVSGVEDVPADPSGSAGWKSYARSRRDSLDPRRSGQRRSAAVLSPLVAKRLPGRRELGAGIAID